MKERLTKKSLNKLKEKLSYLEKEKRRDVASKLKDAASYGDLSENAAYEEAKREQEFLERQIAEIRAKIRNAVVFEKKEGGEVELGSTVSIKNKETGQEETYSIVDSMEADPLKGKISADSPLAKAMRGKKKKDSFILETPQSKINYLITDIKW